MIRRTALGAAALLAAASFAAAAVSVSSTPLGATAEDGHPVSARATFTTSPGQVQVLLENLQANPLARGQTISGLFFTLSGGLAGGSLDSSSGIERSVASNGVFTDFPAVPTGWSFTNNGLQNRLDVLNTPTTPEHLIIGPPDGSNVYSAANPSIAGNGPGNPFLGLSATFTLNVPGVTSATTFETATFQFGTTAGFEVPGNNVPEPAGLALAAGVLPLLRRRRRA